MYVCPFRFAESECRVFNCEKENQALLQTTQRLRSELEAISAESEGTNINWITNVNRILKIIININITMNITININISKNIMEREKAGLQPMI